MDYSVFASDEYTVTVSREWWQILWRADCGIESSRLTKALPNELSGTVMRELRASKELSPGTRDAVHAFAREAIIQPFKDRARRLAEAAEAAEERDKPEAVSEEPTRRSVRWSARGRDETREIRVALRWLVAIGTAIALIAILVSTSNAADDELSRLEPSAVRLAKIFTEGAFYSVTAIGFALCGYIFTRWE